MEEAKAQLLDYLPQFLSVEWLGNSLKLWLLAVLLAVIARAVLGLFLHMVLHRGLKIFDRIESRWIPCVHAVMVATRPWFLTVIAIYFGSQLLSWTPRAATNIDRSVMVFLLTQIGVWGLVCINEMLSGQLSRESSDPGRTTTLRGMGIVIKGVFVIILVLWGLDNFGINIAALVTGLGIGGIAVALAVQNILSDLFASLTIVLDKPFVIGDFIDVGGFNGTIEHIGLKTTRVRSLSGEQLVFPNSDLLQSRIRNYRRMNERRVVFTIGVVYSLSAERMEQAVKIVRQVVEATDSVRLDRAHFLAFADSSLNIEVAYFVLSDQYMVYADVQQAINLRIMRAFAEEGIGFAYPSRSVYLEQIPKNLAIGGTVQHLS
jgi:small-conductance mechanosensitive channel